MQIESRNVKTTYTANINFEDKNYFAENLLKPQYSPVICDTITESLKTEKTHDEHWDYLRAELATKVEVNEHDLEHVKAVPEASVGILRNAFKKQFNDIFRELNKGAL